MPAVAIALLGSSPPDASAQIAPRIDLGGSVEAGRDAERYLRALALARGASAISWSVTPSMDDSTTTALLHVGHPWASRFSGAGTGTMRLLRPMAQAVFNSAFPFQQSVGPVWAGKGATAAVQAGFAARFQRLSAQLAPVAFVAQNASFPLAANGQEGRAILADPRFPYTIDHPQRFGERAYSRVDVGTSFLRADLTHAVVGVSNEPLRWGPGRDYPMVLGPGAGGFPHGFVSTARPVNVGIGSVAARLIAGPLSASPVAQAAADSAGRFASGGMVTIAPRGADGLELGVIRFFDVLGRGSLSRVLRPFSASAIVGAQGDTLRDNVHGENQMASLFFRWAPPRAGFEVYGEWYRDDYPGDFRKLILKPDDLSSFMLGLQRVLVSDQARLRVFHFEIVNSELSHQERGQRGAREPIPPYIHDEVRLGHTQRGRILGSEEAYGGAAWRLGIDEFDARGRVTIGVERMLRLDWLPGTSAAAEVHPDVLYGLRLEAMRFDGGRDYTVSLVPALDLNRDLVRGNDRFNLHAALTIRGW